MVAPVAVRDSRKGLARACGSVSAAVAAEEKDQSLRWRVRGGGRWQVVVDDMHRME